MEEDFVSYLLAFSGLTALVGNRITWANRPQGSALPAIVLYRIDGAPVYSDEGESELFRARIQADCWGLTYGAVKNTARQVNLRLSGQAEFTHNGTLFQIMRTDDEQDSFERGAGEEEFYRVRLDFIVFYKET